MIRREGSPEFASKTRLVRYIDEDQRESRRLPAPAAFMPNPDEQLASPKQHLSVNSLSIESMKEICDYYHATFEPNSVAVSVHTVEQYRAAGKKAGISTKWNSVALSFEFTDFDGIARPAFQHRPVRRARPLPSSESHCGVEVIRSMTDLTVRAFARRLCKARFHVPK